MMIFNVLLALVAYAAIVGAIVIFVRGGYTGCNQDCRQGRKCNCEDDIEIEQ